MKWIAESRPCPVCGSNRFRFLGLRGGSTHWQGSGIETTIVRCRTCDLKYQRPTLVPAGNPYEAESHEYFDGYTDEGSIDRGRRYAADAETFLGSPGRLLEIGCGDGFLIQGAAERGWEVEGLDFTEAFAERGRQRGLSIETAAPGQSKTLAQADRYDAILVFNILEHLYNPMETLSLSLKALRSGGVIGIGVPNEAGLTSRVLNAALRVRADRPVVNMSPTFRPFHVIGFSPKSIRTALSQTGFEVLRVRTVAGHSHLAGGGISRRAGNAALGALLSTANRVGMGDALNVWARKPSTPRRPTEPD